MTCLTGLIEFDKVKTVFLIFLNVFLVTEFISRHMWIFLFSTLCVFNFACFIWKTMETARMVWDVMGKVRKQKYHWKKSSFHVSPLRKTRWVLPRCPSKHRWRGWRGPICHSLQLGPVEMDRCAAADSGSGKLGWNDYLKLGGWNLFEHSRVANCDSFFLV